MRKAMLALLLFLPSSILAATRTWTGTSSGSWSNPANWGGTAPVAGDDLVFPASASNQNNGNDLAPGTAFHSITVSGGSYTLNGNPISLGAGGLTMAVTVQINLPIALATPQQWAANGGTPAVVGAISGSSALTVTGAAEIVFGGANTATGTLTYNGVGSSSSLSLLSGGWPGPVVLNGEGIISDAAVTGPLTVNLAATLLPGVVTSVNTATSSRLTMTAGSTLLVALDSHPVYTVTGPVNLGGATLTLLAGSIVPAGTTFDFLKNQSGSPVIGTFNGLPEGGTLHSSSGQPFTVSYVAGSSGHDVAVTAQAIPATTRIWTGTNSGLWFDPANWGGTAPVSGNDLVFPVGAAHPSNTNDLPAGTAFNSITFTTNGYTIVGNAISLGAGGMSVTGGNILNLPIALSAPQTWTFPTNTTTSVQGVVSGSATLTVAGLGSVSFSGANTATATIVCDGTGAGGVVFGSGTWPGAVVLNSGTVMIGNAAVGPITANGGLLAIESVGNSGNLNMSANRFDVFLFPSPGQLNVTGTVNLGGATLELPTAAGRAVPGSTFTIINNDGVDPIVGTFNGLPEGAKVIAQSGQPFTVTYVGGTGNDVVLTAGKTPTTITVTASPNPASVGQPVTFTAQLSPFIGPVLPTGTVTFTEGATTLGTGTPDSTGKVTLTTTPGPGTHSVTAAYGGDSNFVGSTSAPVSEVVGIASGGAIAAPTLDPRALLVLIVAVAAVGALMLRR